MEKKRNLIYIIAFFAGVAIIIIAALFLRSASNQVQIESVNVIKDGKELTVNSDGRVSYSTENGIFEDQWSSEKTNAYFDHFESNYTGDTQVVRPGQNFVTVVINGQTYTYILNNGEIVDAAGEDATNPDNGTGTGGGDDGDDDDINQYFSPTPFPTSKFSPTPTPTPYNGGGSPFAECLFWRLSYCVTPIPPSPTLGPSASPTPTGDPEQNVIQVNNCGQYITEGNTNPTIINNTVCLPEE